jgi:hypothetical protein
MWKRWTKLFFYPRFGAYRPGFGGLSQTFFRIVETWPFSYVELSI